MRIRELLSCGRPSISFEFFPPKDDAGFDNLLKTMASLRDLRPTYISVTYGAGGSTRTRTLDVVSRIKRDFGIEAMAHLTCVGSSRQELGEVLDHLDRSGVENVLALRGDPPRGAERFEAHPDGFHYANELTRYIRERHTFCVAGACYPEKHPEAVSFSADLEHLKRKVEAGAEFLITQLFFDNRLYFDFVHEARSVGIGVPILPGIMPITNVAQVERFTNMCGASIPERLLEELRDIKDDPAAVLSLGVAHATAQCLDLLQRGAPGIHFYTLNKSPATRTILMALRIAFPPAFTPAGWFL